MPVLSTSVDYTLPVGETRTSPDDYGIIFSGGALPLVGPVITIEGTLNVNHATRGWGGAIGVIFDSGYAPNAAVTVATTGVIRLNSVEGASAVSAPNLTNNGLIEVQARTTATGFSSKFDGAFVNTGTFRVVGGEAARAFNLGYHSAFNNSGTLEVVGGTEATIGFECQGFDAAFVNSGTFKVSDGGVARECIGIQMNASGVEDGASFLNSGRIEADIALQFYVGQTFLKPLQTAKVVNTGTIVGRIEMGGGRMELVNSGRIDGAVRLGAAVGDVLMGDAGADTIAAGGGDDTLEGGVGADVLDGGAGLDVVSYANATAGVSVDLAAGRASGGDGADTVSGAERVLGGVWGDSLGGGAGAETLSGGAGFDALEGRGGDDSLLGGAGADVLIGGAGADTLAGGSGGDVFRAELGSVDRVTDFNAAEGDRVWIDPGVGYGLRQEGADTIIDMGGGSRLVLAGVQLSSLPPDVIATFRPPVAAPSTTAQTTVTVSTANYTVPEGEVFVFTDKEGVVLRAAAYDPSDIRVAGELRVVASAATTGLGQFLNGIRVETSGYSEQRIIEVASGGKLTVDTTAGFVNARGLYSPTTAPRMIVNNGEIDVAARRDAYGLYSYGSSWYRDIDLVNAGTLRVTSMEAAAYGVYLPVSERFQNTGLIEVRGGQITYGVYYFQGGSGFTNSGVIRAIDDDPDRDSIAVFFDQSEPYNGASNSGVLQGDVALKIVASGGPPSPGGFQRDPIVFTNTGEMIGRVEMSYHRQTFVNSGSVKGSVDLGSEDDVYDGRLGTATGMVAGGAGNDSLAGGAGFDNLQGNTGADTETGGAGNDWVVGGKDGDVLSGDAGDDLVYGNLGNDTCDGGEGNDIVRGGQDNDVLRGGAGGDYVSGDKGDDTETGGAGADIFHTFGEAGIDRVLDFSIAEGDRVQLDPGTQYTLAQVGADTVISMAGGGQMILVGIQQSALPTGWIFGA